MLFSAYTDTWRWRRYTGEPLFQSYWLQMCRLLYASKALGQSKRLELQTQSTRVEIGGPIIGGILLIGLGAAQFAR